MPTGKIKKDIVTSSGALLKNTVVDIVNESKSMLTVKDNVGRLYYIDKEHISMEKKRG